MLAVGDVIPPAASRGALCCATIGAELDHHDSKAACRRFGRQTWMREVDGWSSIVPELGGALLCQKWMEPYCAKAIPV